MVAAVDAVVIGAGPAGAAAARLLATWGHAVIVIDNAAPRARGLAESIPPSTRKLLSQIGVLDDIDRASFLRGTGNTVWWASAEPRVEMFSDASPVDRPAYQVFRPEFDRVLLDSAAAAGAEIKRARVRSVTFADTHASVDCEHDGYRFSAAARFVLDCSGRAGVIARRFRRMEPAHRTYALMGVWEREAWDFPDNTHTIVETFEDGWAWSVPLSGTVRHVGVMVGVGQPYRSAVAKTTALRERVDGAVLQREWACDASLYSSETYAGSSFFLVGDAGSFIDPLSSFGVKKALASAWLAAVATHTSLLHPDREPVARDFFSNWEHRVYSTHLRRSRDFAHAAVAAHPSAFWNSRADVDMRSPFEAADEDTLPFGRPRFDATSSIAVEYADAVTFEERPVVRGREIVLETAFAGGIRFAHHVDLVALAELACRSTRVVDLFESYCRRCTPVPLPNVIGGLSLLVDKGILHERS